MLRKTCSCGKIIPYSQTRCESCEDRKVENKKVSNKTYDTERRNQESRRFYNSKEWIITTEYIRNKFNNMCALCWIEDEAMVGADVVHHIIELTKDYSKRIDEDNLITLCHKCHSRVHYSDIDSTLQDIVRDWK